MFRYDPRERSQTFIQKVVGRFFPDRHVMVRTHGDLRSVRLNSISQMALGAVIAVTLGWAGAASYAYVNHERIVSTKEEEVARARAAYKTLLAQVEVYRDRISSVADNLERNHTYAMTLVEQNAVLDQRLRQLQGELETSEEQRELVARQREQMVQHLETLRAGMAQGNGNEEAVAVLIAALEEDAASAVALQRERTAREREDLRAELSRLETEMVEMTDGLVAEQQVASLDVELRKVVLQRDMATSEAVELSDEVRRLRQQIADMEDNQLALFERFSTLARERIGDLEVELKRTGLDINRLLERQGAAQGGPFIPLDQSVWEGDTLRHSMQVLNTHIARWNSLEFLAEALPLGEPVREYHVSSRFGPRRDPISGRAAMHEGLDIAGPIGTPIFAGGPGKVVYAGWRGRYGRLVEIDHGNGLKTRYAHMHKITVKKGDLVDRTTRIGLIGNSGRSTGPHLHYEILHMGRPINPENFIKAGANVFKG